MFVPRLPRLRRQAFRALGGALEIQRSERWVSDFIAAHGEGERFK